MQKFSTKGLNGGEVYILDAEETELLHVNYSFTKIHEGSLVQFRFDGVRPIAGTDMYDVGTCKVNGKQGTILAVKQYIIAAQDSTLEPLIKTRREETPAISAVAAVAAAHVEPVAVETRKGAFSGYVFD